MKPPQIDPGLRELIGLSLIAGVACGLALSQFLIRRCFWCGMRSDDYRGDTTFTMKSDARGIGQGNRGRGGSRPGLPAPAKSTEGS
jgi:hypothetical protein